MNIEAPFEANPKLAESGEPSMRALDDPSMPPEPLAAFDAAMGNPGLDAALSQIAPTTHEVIAFVRMQLTRTFAWLTVQTQHRRNGIECGLESDRIVSVGARDRET